MLFILSGTVIHLNFVFHVVRRVSYHAEITAIIKALKYPYLRDCSIYVSRLNNSGEFINSYPCDNCIKYLIRKGIKRIYYTP